MKRGNRSRAPKRCSLCGAQCSVYLCPRCGTELRELLIGSSSPKGQPGVIWYTDRLNEQAWLQSKLDRELSRVSSNRGYALIADQDAIDLLAEIRVTLASWNGTVCALSGPHSPELAINAPLGARARHIASNVELLRKSCPTVYVLHAALLRYAKEACRVINRPPDSFCGPCPVTLEDGEKCGTLLYAEENDKTVKCDTCRSEHDVERLRAWMSEAVQDMLFTGPEIRHLMETRLADRLPESTFCKLRRDGRLQPRGVNSKDEDLFTYRDICEARLKPVPASKRRS